MAPIGYDLQNENGYHFYIGYLLCNIKVWLAQAWISDISCFQLICHPYYVIHESVSLRNETLAAFEILRLEDTYGAKIRPPLHIFLIILQTVQQILPNLEYTFYLINDMLLSETLSHVIAVMVRDGYRESILMKLCFYLKYSFLPFGLFSSQDKKW